MQNLVDLHIHSVASIHAFSSTTENIEYGYNAGLKVMGVSEHQPDTIGVGAHMYTIQNFRKVPKQYKGMRILKGLELNILEDGSFYEEGFSIDKLDYAIASIHHYIYPLDASEEMNTNNYLKAIAHPKVKILGHIDDIHFKCDYERIIKACVENGVMIEANNNSFAPGSPRPSGNRDYFKKILECCKKYRCPVIMDSDAHICYDVSNIQYCYEVLKEVDFPEELIVNFNLDLLKKYINIE